ncbi:TetR-like C-terminal domain-containing protein [Pseudarthrobacter sp. fls2-241-R2A-127]|uniref:TetR-like C-terminal domain-containing protein n=1 Tax=Pseudarthrobacter sp. fls2-241-R2A-127 TaxID=3040303 RepID=UPI0025559469|nr:TetR-like C-terminal domain-containing protein [Pseudarthrobacter sp. fls2-241-R2A-127]
MMTTATPRPGGRSARVQQAVHQAVRSLLAENDGDRTALSVPLVADRAGVNSSTIYRRWGDLPRLLAAVASNQMLPEQVEDTGSLRGDMEAWFVPYVEEFSSPLGRQVLRDMLADGAVTRDYFQSMQGHVEEIRRLAGLRGERAPATSEIVDAVVAPVIYRILFNHESAAALEVQGRIERLLGERSKGPAET